MSTTTAPFCTDSISLPATGAGPLDGLRMGLKDVFNVAGHVTGFGNPDWQRTHAAAQHNAPLLDALLAAGAQLTGLTATDELTYSLNGENWHYGTPTNPRAPGRIPGGSSSGSASAVAGGQVDVAIGTDCGGSVRLPASYCGLFGMRPSHGRISTAGLLPLATSFDTVGWFASSADHLSRVGAVLLGADPASPQHPTPQRLVIATDLMAQLGEAERAALAPAIARLSSHFAEVIELQITDPEASPDQLMRAFRSLQGAEIWAEHGEWISREQPLFGPGIAERFQNAAKISPAEVGSAQLVREQFRLRLATLLAPGSMLCLPSSPGVAPELNTPAAQLEVFRSKAMRMLCIAGLTGAAQISVPVATLAGLPLGLSLLMPAGADLTLLDFVAQHELRDPDNHGCHLNIPSVHAEVSAAFARYEQALVHNQVAVLDHLFLDSAQTVRYGITENLYGFEMIRAFRAARPSQGLMRSLHNTVITTFGLDSATACTEFSRSGSRRNGRQTQTWIRTAGGWKVAAAHVSLLEAPMNSSHQDPLAAPLQR